MRLLPAIPLLAPMPLLAAEPLPLGESSVSTQIGQMLLGLLLVVGLIFLLAWLLRRMQQFAPRGGQAIRIVASQALGPRERLLLVEVGGEQILIGVSSGRITPLHVLREPLATGTSGETAPGEFAQRLMSMLGRDKDASL